MKKIMVQVLLMSALCSSVMSQSKIVLPLWPNGAKESNGITVPEKIVNQHSIINISEAAMTVQLPATSKANGAAVII